ncbi:MAG TPA: 50S ribosomal protein L22 [Bdellovibrionales bacterium]|nr:50S ribosomal protein L22 [Bdellovibrionales bacterium]
MEVKARLKHARVSAQKARLVADLVRGKDVNDALRILTFLPKKSAVLVKKLIESAVANAGQKETIDADNLYVKTIYVDQGPVMKRFMPRAQGRATEIRKKMSHINVVLDER